MLWPRTWETHAFSDINALLAIKNMFGIGNKGKNMIYVDHHVVFLSTCQKYFLSIIPFYIPIVVYALQCMHNMCITNMSYMVVYTSENSYTIIEQTAHVM